MTSLNDFQIAENFNLTEFECTGHGHRHVKVDRELVEKLQELRDKLDRPLVVTSGFRCEERNNEVGGADESRHLYGEAADISTVGWDIDIEQVAEMAVDIGFTGIGLYDRFIHLDVRDSNAVARWDRRQF